LGYTHIVVFKKKNMGINKAYLSIINRNIAEGMLFKNRYFKPLVYKLNEKEKEEEVIHKYKRNVLLF
jgi:hypothetical protein